MQHCSFVRCAFAAAGSDLVAAKARDATLGEPQLAQARQWAAASLKALADRQRFVLKQETRPGQPASPPP